MPRQGEGEGVASDNRGTAVERGTEGEKMGWRTLRLLESRYFGWQVGWASPAGKVTAGWRRQDCIGSSAWAGGKPTAVCAPRDASGPAAQTATTIRMGETRGWVRKSRQNMALGESKHGLCGQKRTWGNQATTESVESLQGRVQRGWQCAAGTCQHAPRLVHRATEEWRA